jgi:hypothetical protein
MGARIISEAYIVPRSGGTQEVCLWMNFNCTAAVREAISAAMKGMDIRSQKYQRLRQLWEELNNIRLQRSARTSWPG